MTSQEDFLKLLSLFGRGKTLHNYIVPGLNSTMLAMSAGGGVVRLFEMTREQEAYIVPHDHRYNFTCYVLAG
jgi:hypothetical protein